MRYFEEKICDEKVIEILVEKNTRREYKIRDGNGMAWGGTGRDGTGREVGIPRNILQSPSPPLIPGGEFFIRHPHP